MKKPSCNFLHVMSICNIVISYSTVSDWESELSSYRRIFKNIFTYDARAVKYMYEPSLSVCPSEVCVLPLGAEQSGHY